MQSKPASLILQKRLGLILFALLLLSISTFFIIFPNISYARTPTRLHTFEMQTSPVQPSGITPTLFCLGS